MIRPLAGLTRKNLGRELMAGVTMIAIAIPLNIGYAQIAGLPPTAGLYALIVPTIVYALVVSSRQLAASPDAAAAALVASSVGGLAAAGSDDYASLAMAQAILSGLMFVVMAVFKLGFLATFLSSPILVGFVGGLALSILVSQVAKMLGVRIDSGAEFAEKLIDLITGLGGIHWWSVLISMIAVAVLLVGRRLLPTVPWALLVLIVATIATMVWGLGDRGVDVLGAVPAGAPTLTWPRLSLAQWFAVVPSAIALTLVTTAEGLLVARSYAEKHGYPNSSDQNLLAFGLSNIAAGMQGSFAVGSSTSRTAAMDQAGSRTQLPALVLAAGTLLLLLFGTALLADIPSPAIGAIVGVAVWPLLGIADLRRMWRLDRFEFLIAVVCFLVTLLVGSIAGILVSLMLALINIARRSATPAIDVLAADGGPTASLVEGAPVDEHVSPTAPGVSVVRMAAPMFFANGQVFVDAIKRAASIEGVRCIVLDMEAVSDVDVTAAEAFQSLRTWLTARRVGLAFSRLRRHALPRLKRLGIVQPEDRVFATNRAAVAELSD